MCMVFLFPCEILCLQRAEEAVGSLGFEQKAILSHLLWIHGTKLGFSGRAVSALNCCALSPALRPWLNCDSSKGCFFYSGSSSGSHMVTQSSVCVQFHCIVVPPFLLQGCAHPVSENLGNSVDGNFWSHWMRPRSVGSGKLTWNLWTCACVWFCHLWDLLGQESCCQEAESTLQGIILWLTTAAVIVSEPGG